jgi:hypothetical protein
VLVRTPDPGRLRAALASYRVEDGDDGRLRVHGCTTDVVGHLAHANGVELHELTAEAGDLERLFLDLTSEGALR